MFRSHPRGQFSGTDMSIQHRSEHGWSEFDLATRVVDADEMPSEFSRNQRPV